MRRSASSAESGCGKSVTALSIMGFLPKPAGRIQGGDIRFRGESLPSLPPERMREIRGNRIAMIFQEPMTALNPVHRVGRQLAETYALHQPDLNDEVVARRTLGLLEQVGISRARATSTGIPAPTVRRHAPARDDRHGAGEQTDILIADEPTTALDVTIQPRSSNCCATCSARPAWPSSSSPTISASSPNFARVSL